MNGAKAFLETLKARGVKYLFGLPGSTEAPLLEALANQDDIQFVLGLVEPVAVGMADGYARASRGVGVVSLHTSVGTLAGSSLLYNAWRDGVPVVAVGCHKASPLLGRMGFTTTINTTEQVRTLVKWTHQTLNASQIGEETERAIHYALSQPQGPTFLMIPEDLLASPVPEGSVPTPSAPLRPVRPDGETVAEMARYLHEARLPVFLAGTEIARADAVPLAIQLAEELALPVFWEIRRQVVELPFPGDHPNFVGEYSHRHPLVQEGDVLLALGANLFVQFSPPAEPEVPVHLKLIHSHRNPQEVGKIYPPTIGVQADAGLLLADLLEAVRALGPLPAEVRKEREAAVARARAEYEKSIAPPPPSTDPNRMTVHEASAVMAKVLPRDTIIVDESVTSGLAFAQTYPLQPSYLYRTCGGSLGWGVPAAIGVQMARPDERVVAVVGDGCFSFTPQAVWTAVQHRIPLVVLVWRNEKYRAVEAGVERHIRGKADPNRHPGIMISPIDTCAVAAGYGARTARVTRPDELGDALAEAMRLTEEERRPAVIDVAVY